MCIRTTKHPGGDRRGFATEAMALFAAGITGKAREVVNLVVSQVNGCRYCLAAHTALARRAGFDLDVYKLLVARMSKACVRPLASGD